MDTILYAWDEGIIDDVELIGLMEVFGEPTRVRREPCDYHTIPLFDVNRYSAKQVWEYFRFERNDLERLRTALHIPDIIHTRNRLKENGLRAMCLLLRRLAYPCRLSDLVPMFGRPECELSQIINSVLGLLYERHHHLLDGDIGHMNFIDPGSFSRATYNAGSALINCFGFIDGTARPIARPQTDQRLFYSGHKRQHCLKFQSVVCPNGLIVHMFGPLEGCRHDSRMLSLSGLVNQIRNSRRLRDYCLFGDHAYPLRAEIICPYKGANLTNEQQQFNLAMSPVRESVEWGFEYIITNFAFVDFRKNQKLFLQPIGQYYKVATLLSNCKTCLYGNQISDYFRCDPPNLENYINNI